MADVALRSGDLVSFRRPLWRGGASGRGGFDRHAPRIDGGVDRHRGDVATRPVPWPVVPTRDPTSDVMVAPSSTIPAVVAHPRVTTAAPFADAAERFAAPAIRIGPEARCPLPRDLRRRGLGVAAAALTHLLCLAALLAMPRIEASGGGVETEAVEIAIVFAEASLDAEAGTASAPRETTPEALPPEALAPEPVTAEPPPLAPPPLPVEPPVLATAMPAETVVTPPPIAPIATPVEAPAPTPAVARIEPPKPVVPAKPEPKQEVAKAERRSEAKPRPAAQQPVGNAARDSTSGARTAGATAAAGAGAVADWRAAVLAALARAKRYPDDARDRGVGGRAVVGFTLSRDGTVSAVALVASSGVPALDAATLAMPRRAAFPPMPAGGPSTQSFTAGVRYDLR